MPFLACKLCLNERELRNSHIIPEFTYRPLYDEIHRTFEWSRGSATCKPLQKGYREYLLCDDCEQLLNERYEKPFKRIWYDAPVLPRTLTGSTHQLSGLPVPEFKLFHLSVLWRACISSLPVFSKARLGPYAERLRTLLLSGEPCPATYEIFAVVLRNPLTGGPANDIILQPFNARFADQITNVFVFGGCVWHYLVCNRRVDILAGQTVSDEGTLLLQIVDFDEFTPFANLLRSTR